jgi:hypothetical protein
MSKLTARSNICIALLAIILILALLFLLARLTLIWLFQPNYWSVERVNSSLSIMIPSSATHVQIQGHQGRGGFLFLSFDAPPSDAIHFANQFCSGILHPGYDPFNAIDIAEPFTYAFPIRIDRYSYYSYSTHTSENTSGNRCWSGGQLQIRLEATDSRYYSVSMDKRYSCESACRFITLEPIKPLPDSPLELLGVSSLGNQLVSSRGEICIGVAMKTT